MTWTNQMGVVTGAGSGIGRAIAQMMASRGAAVAAVDLDIVTATETVELITPAGTRSSAQDIASAVCFLASDEVSYITGHHLVVDGGWRAKYK